MSRYPLESVTDLDLELLREYFASGESRAISAEHQRMITICRDAWGLMQRYPQRNVLIRELMAKDDITYKAAAKYVDFTRGTWGNVMDYNQSFLNTFLINKLVEEINDPKAKPEVRAKNLATLQKYNAALPQTEIDPKLLEQNQIVINFNLGGKALQLSQEQIRQLPQELQEVLLSGVKYDITDVEAEDILDS